jgi:hypothetical protein
VSRVCPNDATALVQVERSGVTIEACPSCRGIWLDRGELDKILAAERSAVDDDFLAEVGGERSQQAPPPQQQQYRQSEQHYAPKKKKRRSLLEEFLDFD